MPEEQLQETIHFEAEQYIPFDISDVNLDFQILGENENNPNQMSVFLVAAKKEMVNDYINLVTLVGLNPCIIDVEAFALQNIFEANYDIQDENVALIDIGASKTSLNILKDNSSVFMRDVALGLHPDQPEDHVDARLLLRSGRAHQVRRAIQQNCPPTS